LGIITAFETETVR